VNEEQHQITRVLQAFYGNAWLIEPAKFEAIAEFIEARGSGALLDPEEIRGVAAGRRDSGPSVQQAPQAIGIIPITGVLVHRTYGVSNWSGGTSTEQAGRTFDGMMADPSISAIVLDIDSPGGMVEGTIELADKIAAGSNLGTKRVVALANGYAASAAYWIGVSAQQFFSIPSGDVGSIGAIAMHVDQSGLDAKVGIKRTLIRSGKYKGEGHPYGPLEDSALAAVQQRLDEMYAEFVDGVAAGRRVSPETVINDFGEGRMVRAAHAAAADMIDGILTFDQLIGKIIATPRGEFIRVTSSAADVPRGIAGVADTPAGTSGREEHEMSVKDLTLEQLRTERPDLVKSIEDGAAAVLEPLHEESQAAAVTAAKAAGVAEGTAEGMGLERVRCVAIVDAAAKCQLEDTAAPVISQQIAAGADPRDAMIVFQAEKIRQLAASQPEKVGPAPPDAGKEKETDVTTPEGHLAAAQAYQKEHGGSLSEALRATAPKRK